MKIAYRVQHSAGRDATLDRLLPLLPPGTEVVTDREDGPPNPMRGYLQCLRTPPSDITHLCVIQDDALPCKGFGWEVQHAVEQKPDEMISLFVGGLPGRTKRSFLESLSSGARWSQIYFREVHHVVGLVWPVPLAASFLEWYETAKIPGPTPPRSDDAVVGFWARTTKRLFWATVPCLVEHPDDFPSTIRMHTRTGDRGRQAIAFLDTMT